MARENEVFEDIFPFFRGDDLLFVKLVSTQGFLGHRDWFVEILIVAKVAAALPSTIDPKATRRCFNISFRKGTTSSQRIAL